MNPRHAVLETAALPTELYPYIMAEKMGFEPMLPLSNTNGLANRPLQPLEYFSIAVKTFTSMILAERVGFEPTVPCGITGFQDQLLKPLGHLSTNIAGIR